MPLFRETLDQPIGLVHVKDVVTALHGALQAGEEADSIGPSDLMRPVLFVPPSMPAMELLVKMQASRSHMALVIDEYGGTDGLVTIEDLIEEIVGEIEDEHDEEEVLLKPLNDGHWRANARLPLEDLDAVLNVPLPPVDDMDDIDTLGGLVFALAGRVPERGEIITSDVADARRLSFIIRDGDARRIKTIDIRLSQSAAS
jgi:CBS domain containing-hemolysin-like protein